MAVVGCSLFALLTAFFKLLPWAVVTVSSVWFLATSRPSRTAWPAHYLSQPPPQPQPSAAAAAGGGGCGAGCACAAGGDVAVGAGAGAGAGAGFFQDSRIVAAMQDEVHGFARPEMGTEEVADTVSPYSIHIFIMAGPPASWPSSPDQPVLKEMKALLKEVLPSHTKARITLAHSEDPTFAQRGDILVFPDLVRYPAVRAEDVRSLFSAHFVDGRIGASAVPLTSSFYVFVCCHASRDARCGACGPALLAAFAHAARDAGMADTTRVMSCSHVGGHKYAGNCVAWGRQRECGAVIGDWFGYVTPSRVPDILASCRDNSLDGVKDIWRGASQPSQQ